MSRTIKALRFVLAVAAAALAAAFVPSAPPDPADGRGSLYGLLSGARPPVPVAQELLLIQSAPREGSRPFQAMELAESVLVLHELEADRLLALEPLDGQKAVGAVSTERRAGLEARFDKEFSLIRKNIATLFEAIRLGSVRTKDTARFVDELLALVDNSSGRLLGGVLEGDDAGGAALSQAIAALGAGRYAAGPAAFGFVAPEFPDAAALVEAPTMADGTPPFRRLDLADLVRYSSLDKALAGMMSDMERAGYMAAIDPDSHPPALRDYASALRQDMLERPSDEAAGAWRSARERYLQSIDSLLAGRTEASLVAGYDGLLAAETLEEAGATKIRDLRRGVTASFSAARSAYVEFLAMRNRLKGAARGAICVIGPLNGPADPRMDRPPEPSAAESAAALINASLAGRFVRAPSGTGMRALLFLPAIATAGLMALFGTLGSALAAVAAMVLTAGLFASMFLFRAVWIDPGAAVAVVAAAAAASLAVETASRWRIAYGLRRRTGERLPDSVVAALAAGHSSPATDDVVLNAAIVSVRHAGPAALTAPEDGERYSAALRAFHAGAADAVKKRGGVILSADGFIVTAGFGTPFQVAAASGADGADPARAAFDAVSAIVREDPEAGSEWRFGIDSGECRFMYSPINGYGAVGRPLKYARLLSGLASKYGGRVLVTIEAADLAGDGWTTRRLDSLVEKATGAERAFLELIVPPRP